MLKTLHDVTNRIVERYGPEKIILYGSYGTKRSRDDSDIDLLIVKDTDKRFIERVSEVEKILSDRDLPLDIRVYTSREVRYLYSIGSPFIEEIIATGRLLYMRKATTSWLRDAVDELDSSVVLFEHGKYRGACYHSQQCAEKGLKALIIEKGMRPGRTHDIVELRNKAAEMGWDIDLSMDNAVFLNSVYKGRYPTEEGLLPHGEPSREDAEKAIASLKNFMKRLANLLGEEG